MTHLCGENFLDSTASDANTGFSVNTALLALEDGSVFYGTSIGIDGESVGEVVFNTAMTGHQEILTDPSSRHQIVALTYPHVGNTGLNAEDAESDSVHAAGLVIRHSSEMSSWRGEQTLEDYCREHNVVAISDIDTRELTRRLRDQGVMKGCIVAGKDLDATAAIEKARAFAGLAGMDLISEIGSREEREWTVGSWGVDEANRPALSRHVVAYDYGVKYGILRKLVDRGCRITLFPADTPVERLLATSPDGILVGNGPGDPAACTKAIDDVGRMLEADIPLFGISLGYQLLALASGAKTSKMKLGNYGSNHPIQEISSKRVLISSQNHAFTVDEDSLPDHLEATHRSLFDGSLQGIRRTDCPAFGIQGHPEASPGPHDLDMLFDQFVDSIDARR